MHDEPTDDEGRPGGLFDAEPTSAAAGRHRKREPATPLQRALGLLVRREHSRKELARKLVGRGLEAEAVVAAVDQLAAAGWQDDARFAASLVRQRAGSGYGPIYIRAELGTHGFDSEQVAAALDAYDGEWLENARELVVRRFGEAIGHDWGVRRKAADLLMRRGFPGEIVRRATRVDLDE